jgi:hypothetical protein
MLGMRLKRERKNTCKYKCCTRTKAYLRTTKQERNRDKRSWKKGVDNATCKA